MPALKVFYIGTNYYGFQRQKKVKTIEGCLFKAFQRTELIDDPQTFRYRAAGRTDRGVHALGQVIAFSTSRKVILGQLNAYLPNDIRCWAISREIPEEFDPRFDALSKHYKYFLPRTDENTEEMKNAADHLIGIHNFKNLSKTERHANPIREVIQLKIKEVNNILQFDVIGKSFLWEMVRKIVSVLSLVGKGLMSIVELKKLLDPNFIHKKGIPPVPAWGLLLYDIHYSSINFERDAKIINEISSQLRNEISRILCLQKVFNEICMGMY